MSGDARGFTYSLEAVRRQASWQLDALHGELAAATRNLAAASAEFSQLQQEHRALAAQAAPSAMAVVDPSRSRRVLVYLADVQRRLQLMRERVAALTDTRDTLRERARAQQVKSDSLEQHREGCLREHLALADHSAAVEADRDWLARTNWRVQAEASAAGKDAQ
jgi:flagellar biosynthesis chaperone FliJ